jgi:aspartyl-tRNA(Asn)/glutamyl-tRNA(Gln) amidotransferase subunit C
MQVTDELFDNIAHLSRLAIPQAEKPAMKAAMQRMVSFVEKLNELDTTGVPPLLHMSSETNVLRPDLVQGSISSATALSNAPLQDEQYFKVPKVIKK